VTEETIAKVADFRASDLSEREKIALEYTERYIFDPAGMDDAFFTRLREHFTEEEIVELGFILIMYNGLHRFNASIDLGPHHADRLWYVSVLDGTKTEAIPEGAP